MMPLISRRALRGLLLAAGVVLASAGAHAQEVPSKLLQDILIRTTILTFNDANVTGNYAVLHARTSKAFQAGVTLDQLKAAFKVFADRKIGFWSVAASPIMPEKAAVDDKGVLTLAGMIETPGSSNVRYSLQYVMQDGEWEILDIDIGTRAK